MLRSIRTYLRREDGVAATEAAFVLPILIALLAGVYDLGQAIVINHKTVVAAQIMGDLIARTQMITEAEVEDIAIAGSLALEPYDSSVMGYDIVSLRFDDDGDAEILWRVTDRMGESDSALTQAETIGEPGEGLIAVTTTFSYTPAFSQFVTGNLTLTETAFLRGRRSAVVNCPDCAS